MTRDELRDRAKQICERLTVAVAQDTPEGLGRWPRAWEITAAPSADFMLALATWEVAPDADAAAGVKAAFDAVVNAWRRAANEYDLQDPHNALERKTNDRFGSLPRDLH